MVAKLRREEGNLTGLRKVREKGSQTQCWHRKEEVGLHKEERQGGEIYLGIQWGEGQQCPQWWQNLC